MTFLAGLFRVEKSELVNKGERERESSRCLFKCLANFHVQLTFITFQITFKFVKYQVG